MSDEEGSPGFLDISDESLDEYIKDLLDNDLEMMRKNVREYSRCKFQAEFKGDVVAAMFFKSQQTLWVICHEICRRVESSPAKLFNGGENFGQTKANQNEEETH